MKDKRLMFEMTAVLVFLAGLGALYLGGSGRASGTKMVSASAPRLNQEELWNLLSHPPVKAYSYDPKAFAAYRLERTSTSLTFIPADRYDERYNPADDQPNNYTVERVAADGSIHVGSGTLKLEAIAAETPNSYTQSAAPVDPEHPRPLSKADLRYFHADGKPYAEGEPKPAGAGSMSFDTIWGRQYDFHFVLSGIEHISLMEFRVFDARTRWEFGWGRVNDSTSSSIAASAQVLMERPAPADLMLDLAWGNPEAIEKPARDGAEFLFSTTALRLVALSPGIVLGVLATTRAGGNILPLRLDPGMAGKCCALFVLDTEADAALTVSAVDDAGAVHASVGIMPSGRVRWYSFDLPAERVEKLRIECLPNVTRAIVSLPELYGMPEANRGVKDLTKVRIPYLCIDDQYRWERAIEDALQLRIVDPGIWGHGPRGAPLPAAASPHFPMEFRDVLAGDLLKQYESYMPPHQLQIDVAKGEMRIVYPKPSWIEQILALWGAYLSNP